MQNKIKKIFLKFRDKNFIKGISTLIGAGCINFLVGAIFSLCTLSVYEISYIKGLGGSIEIEHLTFYYPIEVFFQCISAFISGIIYKKLGLHKTNFIGVTILSFGYYLMYLSKHLIMDILAMIIGGIGTGIIFYPSTTNAYEWFKDHNGIIVGIMETMISLGSFFFALIGEKIINKNEIPSHDDDNLYDFEIGKRIKIYLMAQIITLASAFVLSLILMYEKKNYHNKNEYNFDNINDSELISLETKSDNDLMTLENKNEENYKDDLNDEIMKDTSPNRFIIEKRKEKLTENINDIIDIEKEKIIPVKNNIDDKLVKHILKKNMPRKKNSSNTNDKKKRNRRI